MKILDLKVYRGPCEVISNLTIDIPKGKWTSIVGPNGAGKSSLLQGIADILPITGSITIDNVNLQDVDRKARAKTIAWLAQNNDAAEEFSELTVYDTVMLGRIPHQGWLHLPSSLDHEVVHESLFKTHTQSLASRFLHELSGGEKQRVLLARLLAVQADILLMDEPLANLDPPHQADWLEWVRCLTEQGAAVVSVLHELNLALQADGVWVMSGGQLVHAGLPNDPATHQALSSVFQNRLQWREWQDDDQTRWVALPK